jgi:hypothetical protein
MAAGPTYSSIATTTLGSAAAVITFSSFSGYTDLRLVMNILPTGSGSAVELTVNNDSANNYSWTNVYGTGTATVSSRTSNYSNILGGYGLGSSTTIPTQFELNFQNYSNTTTNKTILSRFTDPSQGLTGAAVSIWRSTAAITSIKINNPTSTYAAGSTFTLYGIQAA